ncbi:MAG: BAR domain-containing protein, partial [Ignavibacteriaceae bacterium]
QIPHTIQGQIIGMDELNSLNANLSHQLKNEYKIPEKIFSEIEEISSVQRYKQANLKIGFVFILKDFFGIKSVIHKLRHELTLADIPKSQRNKILKTVKSKLIISRRIGLLQTMQKIFRYWHVVHLPFAILMFVIMFIHIAVTIIFGYKWIF